MWRLYGDYYNIWRSLYGMDQNMDIGDGWMDIQRSWNFMWNPQWTDHTQHTQPWSSLSLNRISELCHGESNLRSQKISKKCDTLMSWWKSCFMGFLEMSWCWSEIAWVSLRFPQSLGFLKLATVVFEGIHGTGDPGLPTWARWEGPLSDLFGAETVDGW
jgi:hypothetical protein